MRYSQQFKRSWNSRFQFLASGLSLGYHFPLMSLRSRSDISTIKESSRADRSSLLCLASLGEQPKQAGHDILGGSVGNLRKDASNDLLLERNGLSQQPIFWNYALDKGKLKNFVSWFLKAYGEKKTLELLEQLKVLGFGYATEAGISLGIEDLKIPPQKSRMLAKAKSFVDQSRFLSKRGSLTDLERTQSFMQIWNEVNEDLKDEVVAYFKKTNILNPVYMMAFSGARGNLSQVRQLVGMRGLMSDPQGKIIDFPILSNFREGLTLTEYLISTYGARKGIVDTALRTATAGYLTRRLVDVAQHVVVSKLDCGTQRGIFLFDMKDGVKTIYAFQNRLIGRVLAQDIYADGPSESSLSSESFTSTSGKNVIKRKIASKNAEINENLANQISKVTKRALVRSPLTCEQVKRVCQLCYGWSLATSRLVSIGEAVGVIAGQSIGEPGTQLTMRTFHTGGVFAGNITEQINAPFDGKIEYSHPIAGSLLRVCLAKNNSILAFLTKSGGTMILKPSSEESQEERKEKIYKLPPFTLLFARHGECMTKQSVLAQISGIDVQAARESLRGPSLRVLREPSEAQRSSGDPRERSEKEAKTQKSLKKQESEGSDGSVSQRETQTSEQTVYTSLEGEIYYSELDLMEEIDPKYGERVSKSENWAKVWVLAAKIFQNPVPSKLSLKHSKFITNSDNSNFPQVKDFISKQTPVQEIQWFSPFGSLTSFSAKKYRHSHGTLKRLVLGNRDLNSTTSSLDSLLGRKLASQDNIASLGSLSARIQKLRSLSEGETLEGAKIPEGNGQNRVQVSFTKTKSTPSHRPPTLIHSNLRTKFLNQKNSKLELSPTFVSYNFNKHKGLKASIFLKNTQVFLPIFDPGMLKRWLNYKGSRSLNFSSSPSVPSVDDRTLASPSLRAGSFGIGGRSSLPAIASRERAKQGLSLSAFGSRPAVQDSHSARMSIQRITNNKEREQKKNIQILANDAIRLPHLTLSDQEKNQVSSVSNEKFGKNSRLVLKTKWAQTLISTGLLSRRSNTRVNYAQPLILSNRIPFVLNKKSFSFKSTKMPLNFYKLNLNSPSEGNAESRMLLTQSLRGFVSQKQGATNSNLEKFKFTRSKKRLKTINSMFSKNVQSLFSPLSLASLAASYARLRDPGAEKEQQSRRQLNKECQNIFMKETRLTFPTIHPHYKKIGYGGFVKFSETKKESFFSYLPLNDIPLNKTVTLKNTNVWQPKSTKGVVWYPSDGEVGDSVICLVTGPGFPMLERPKTKKLKQIWQQNALNRLNLSQSQIGKKTNQSVFSVQKNLKLKSFEGLSWTNSDKKYSRKEKKSQHLHYANANIFSSKIDLKSKSLDPRFALIKGQNNPRLVTRRIEAYSQKSGLKVKILKNPLKPKVLKVAKKPTELKKKKNLKKQSQHKFLKSRKTNQNFEERLPQLKIILNQNQKRELGFSEIFYVRQKNYEFNHCATTLNEHFSKKRHWFYNSKQSLKSSPLNIILTNHQGLKKKFDLGNGSGILTLSLNKKYKTQHTSSLSKSSLFKRSLRGSILKKTFGDRNFSNLPGRLASSQASEALGGKLSPSLRARSLERARKNLLCLKPGKQYLKLFPFLKNQQQTLLNKSFLMKTPREASESSDSKRAKPETHHNHTQKGTNFKGIEFNRLRVHFKPGWVYYTFSPTNVLKKKKKIQQFGQQVLDDLYFDSQKILCEPLKRALLPSSNQISFMNLFNRLQQEKRGMAFTPSQQSPQAFKVTKGDEGLENAEQNGKPEPQNNSSKLWTSPKNKDFVTLRTFDMESNSNGNYKNKEPMKPREWLQNKKTRFLEFSKSMDFQNHKNNSSLSRLLETYEIASNLAKASGSITEGPEKPLFRTKKSYKESKVMNYVGPKPRFSPLTFIEKRALIASQVSTREGSAKEELFDQGNKVTMGRAYLIRPFESKQVQSVQEKKTRLYEQMRKTEQRQSGNSYQLYRNFWNHGFNPQKNETMFLGLCPKLDLELQPVPIFQAGMNLSPSKIKKGRKKSTNMTQAKKSKAFDQTLHKKSVTTDGALALEVKNQSGERESPSLEKKVSLKRKSKARKQQSKLKKFKGLNSFNSFQSKKNRSIESSFKLLRLINSLRKKKGSSRNGYEANRQGRGNLAFVLKGKKDKKLKGYKKVHFPIYASSRSLNLFPYVLSYKLEKPEWKGYTVSNVSWKNESNKLFFKKPKTKKQLIFIQNTLKCMVQHAKAKLQSQPKTFGSLSVVEFETHKNSSKTKTVETKQSRMPWRSPSVQSESEKVHSTEVFKHSGRASHTNSRKAMNRFEGLKKLDGWKNVSYYFYNVPKFEFGVKMHYNFFWNARLRSSGNWKHVLEESFKHDEFRKDFGYEKQNSENFRIQRLLKQKKAENLLSIPVASNVKNHLRTKPSLPSLQSKRNNGFDSRSSSRKGQRVSQQLPISKNFLNLDKNQIFQKEKPVGFTRFYSPFEGLVLKDYSQCKSEDLKKTFNIHLDDVLLQERQGQKLILTKEDLFSLNFPSETNNSLESLSNRKVEFREQIPEQKELKGKGINEQFKNWSEKQKFFNKISKEPVFENILENHTKFQKLESDYIQKSQSESYTILNLQTTYEDKNYRLNQVHFQPAEEPFKFRIGKFSYAGDSLYGDFCLPRAGQVIHVNRQKVTFRKAEYFSLLPRAILHAYNGHTILPNNPVMTLPFETLNSGDIVQGIPKVEQYLEARTTIQGRLFLNSLPVLLYALYKRYLGTLEMDKAVRQSLLKIQQILVDGVQRVYRSQGVGITDKHLEVIVRQMTSKVKIIYGGQTGFFPGELVDLELVERVNKSLVVKVVYEPVVLGITRASLEVDSFLSAASFQQTTKVLTRAALENKRDFLKGLKENLLVGNLLPAGTGYVVPSTT